MDSLSLGEAQQILSSNFKQHVPKQRKARPQPKQKQLQQPGRQQAADDISDPIPAAVVRRSDVPSIRIARIGSAAAASKPAASATAGTGADSAAALSPALARLEQLARSGLVGQLESAYSDLPVPFAPIFAPQPMRARPLRLGPSVVQESDRKSLESVRALLMGFQ